MPRGLSLADFKAVLFDVDGTLVDTLPALIRGLGDSYEHFNGVRPSDDQIQATIGLPLRKQMRMFTTAVLSDAQVDQRSDYTIERFEDHSHLEREFTASVEMLRLTLKEGFKTALVTSKSAQEIALFEKRCPWFLDVHTVVCASDVQHPKPDPESALLACERLGVAPHEAVMIGDSIFDMRCARSAGVASVAVGYGSGSKEALLAEDPDLYFDSAEELLAWAQQTALIPPCLESQK
jgi:HAD superfamily hydrolase (TIGR01549 family)